MILIYCISIIIVVSIICITKLISIYINRKNCEYKLQIITKIGFLVSEIDKNFSQLDYDSNAKILIYKKLNDLKNLIFYGSDNLIKND